MQNSPPRNSRVRSIDTLRTRIWFTHAMMFTGFRSPHSFWLNVDKKKTSRSRWYNYLSGKAVPRDDIVKRVEDEVPGTARVFNALFWSVLKGDYVSHEDVSKEFDIITESYTGRHKLLQMDFWMSSIDENPLEFEMPAFTTILESRNGEDLLQITVLIMALAGNSGNKDLWNYMCRAYRNMLPLHIPTIRWAHKAELFDELDGYIQERVHSGVSYRPIKRNWRTAKPEVRRYLIEEYEIVFYLEFLDSNTDIRKLPEGFVNQLAKLLATKFCNSEDFMLYSWLLCDPIALDVCETINDIHFYDDGDITVDRIFQYLDSLRYFEETWAGHKAYMNFQYIRTHHFNFLP